MTKEFQLNFGKNHLKKLDKQQKNQNNNNSENTL